MDLVVVIVPAVVVFVVIILIALSVRLVQQGKVGVIKRLGQYRAIREPGIVLLVPFVDQLQLVDIREVPRPGDRQQVISRDNVAVQVTATIFSQIVDARAALFSVASYEVAVDQQSRSALRSVFGSVTLDEALSGREQINTQIQQQMEAVTDKWGIRINRVEIVEILPPPNILQAMALQKQADQEKRAVIFQSEGQRQSAINVADGQKQAAILEAEGTRQAAILNAEGTRQAAILNAEGRAQAINTVYSAIRQAAPDPTLVSILQLDTLSKFAESDNATIVVPYEAAGILGAAQALRSVIQAAPSVDSATP